VSEANKELVRAYTREVFDEGNADAVDRYLAPHFYNHVTGRWGTEDFKQLAAEIGGSAGSANAIDFLVAEDDLVVAFMTVTRTVQEDTRLFGFDVPGEGRSYTVHHVHVYRVADGKLREHWALRDDIGMLRQLGVLEGR